MKQFFAKTNLLAALPLIAVIAALLAVFIYGWSFDHSIGGHGYGWSDQKTYTATSHRFATGHLPREGAEMHFAIGYPLLGVVGYFISHAHPFVFVSLALLLASGALCYLAVRSLYGTGWALAFVALLFYWDGVLRTFSFVSELFLVPWNNQVLFFAMSFYLWLFVTKLKPKPSWKIVASLGFISGFCFLTREESILFVAPATAAYLYLTKSDWRRWLGCFAIIGAVFYPQLLVKFLVAGSIENSGRNLNYGQIREGYLRPDLLRSNLWETIVNSHHYGVLVKRQALFQAAPWLWLGPIGIAIVLFVKKFPIGLKVFMGLSLFLMLFYLSGANMSAHKLAYNCLRYISPGFIALNLGVIILVRQVAVYISDGRKKQGPMKKIIAIVQRIINVAPTALPAGLAAFGVVAMFLLVIGHLETWLTWALGLAAFAAAFWVVAQSETLAKKITKEQLYCDGFALLGVLSWALVNAKYSAQNIFIGRDPAVYNNAGQWLTSHDSLRIPIDSVIAGLPSLQPTSAGFSLDLINPFHLVAQGLHLLPVFLGLGGRLGGAAFAVHLNALFGAIALLALYGFARQLAKPRYALLITGIFALTLPMIYFSRDSYTEPLAMLLTMSTLSLLWLAQKKKTPALWFLAGLVGAAGTLTRADGYLTVAAMIIFVAIYLALQPLAERATAIRNSLFLVLGATISGALGWFDLTQLSNHYYADLKSQVHMEFKMIILLTVIAAISVLLSWRTDIIKWLDKTTKSWRTPAIMGMVVVVILILASRPFWLVGHEGPPNALVVGLQTAAGHAIDNNRSYSEQTVNWIWWYLGPVLALFGAAGLVMASGKVFKKRGLLLLPALLIIGLTALVYLNRPSISPDQVWASRRLLPVILPGLAALAVLALESFDKLKPVVKYRFVVWPAAVILMVAPVLYISYPFLRLRSYVPQLAQINSVCANLPPNAEVIWVGIMRIKAPQPTQGYCGIPSAGTQSSSKSDLARYAKHMIEHNKTPILGVTLLEAKTYNISPSDTTNTGAIVTRSTDVSLFHPPRHIVSTEQTLLLARIQPDGSLRPLK